MQHYWKSKIEKHGGKVSNSVIGVTCLVVSPAERDRGGSSKVAEAVWVYNSKINLLLRVPEDFI